MNIPSLLMLCLVATTVSAQAREPFVYPANNQPPDLQQKDQLECRQWAFGQTGYDPEKAATGAGSSTASSGASQQKDRPVLKSAAKGAIVGGIGGSMGGEFGEGAAAGAAVGGAVGLVKKKKQEQQAKQQAAATTSANKEMADNYYRAYSVCLEARGYKVK